MTRMLDRWSGDRWRDDRSWEAAIGIVASLKPSAPRAPPLPMGACRRRWCGPPIQDRAGRGRRAASSRGRSPTARRASRGVTGRWGDRSRPRDSCGSGGPSFHRATAAPRSGCSTHWCSHEPGVRMSATPKEDFLEMMARSSRARVDAARAVQSEAALLARIAATPAAPRLSLSPQRFDLIAEVKLRSPATGHQAQSRPVAQRQQRRRPDRIVRSAVGFRGASPRRPGDAPCTA